MNKTEEKALNWLTTQGNKRENITYRKIPTFITSDNKTFEIKRLYGNQIIFYSTHYEKLKPSTLILVFKDSETKPFLKFKFEEIKSQPKTYKNIEINWVNPNQKIKTIRLSEKTKARLQSYGKMGENFDQLVNRLLNKIKNEE